MISDLLFCSNRKLVDIRHQLTWSQCGAQTAIATEDVLYFYLFQITGYDGLGWNWMESVSYCWTVQTVNCKVSLGQAHTDSIYKPVCLSSCWNFTAPVKVVQATMAAMEETELQP